jgi:hypothetical protein
MNEITILIWITIAIIAVIAIILVKLHYKGDELAQEEGSILPDVKNIDNLISSNKEKFKSKNDDLSQNRPSLSPNQPQQNKITNNLFRQGNETSPETDAYIIPEVENNNLKNYEYESQNQVLINYDTTVEKFQEPIKQTQMDIMTQNNKDTSELKDLFTIDELIKESKRKDSEREKESQKIGADEEDEELNAIKESIKNKTTEPLIEEVIADDKEETISDLIKDEKDSSEEKIESIASQKDIDEAITTASEEIDKEDESKSEDENITDVLLNQDKQEEISEPSLKTPNKVEDTKDYKLGASIDDANLFEDKEEGMDLDYRKDLDKFTNKIKGSKLFKEVKDKITPETQELPQDQQDEFIKNVNEYDEYEPIINETHIDYDGTYEEYHDQKLREANTRRIFNKSKTRPEPELARPRVGEIKNKPTRDNIKVNINNNEIVLKKGDEIIFNHDGETYSSQVYAINGDDIAVKYRGKAIKIKTSDVKKIY